MLATQMTLRERERQRGRQAGREGGGVGGGGGGGLGARGFSQVSERPRGLFEVDLSGPQADHHAGPA